LKVPAGGFLPDASVHQNLLRGFLPDPDRLTNQIPSITLNRAFSGTQGNRDEASLKSRQAPWWQGPGPPPSHSTFVVQRKRNPNGRQKRNHQGLSALSGAFNSLLSPRIEAAGVAVALVVSIDVRTVGPVQQLQIGPLPCEVSSEIFHFKVGFFLKVVIFLFFCFFFLKNAMPASGQAS